MSYLLDTNICIALLKAKPDSNLVERIRSHPPTDLWICSIVRAELHFGARKSQCVAENLAISEQFLSVFPNVDFGPAAARQYGIIRSILETQGTPIGENDLLIAAIALSENATVATRNTSEFSRVPELKTEAW